MNSTQYEEVVRFIRKESYPEAAQLHDKANGATKEVSSPILLAIFMDQINLSLSIYLKYNQIPHLESKSER